MRTKERTAPPTVSVTMCNNVAVTIAAPSTEPPVYGDGPTPHTDAQVCP